MAARFERGDLAAEGGMSFLRATEVPSPFALQLE